MTLNRKKSIATFEKHLETVNSVDNRRRIEERLSILRITLRERIQVFQDRLVHSPNSGRYRERLERLRQRQASQWLHKQTNRKQRLDIIQDCLAYPSLDIASRKKLQARQKNLQAHISMSLLNPVEMVHGKLAFPHIVEQDELEARLAMVEARKVAKTTSKALAAQIKRVEARIEQHPNQPKLRIRLERLKTKGDKQTHGQAVLPKHRQDRLETRIHSMEKRLENPNCKNRVELEIKVNKLYQLKERFAEMRTIEPRVAKPFMAILRQRVHKLEGMLCYVENVETCKALEDRLERVRKRLETEEVVSKILW